MMANKLILNDESAFIRIVFLKFAAAISVVAARNHQIKYTIVGNKTVCNK